MVAHVLARAKDQSMPPHQAADLIVSERLA